MASAKYEGWTKEQAIDEIKARKVAGSTIKINLNSETDKLIAALESDDVFNGKGDDEERADVRKAFETFESDDPLENQVRLQPEMPTEATQPSDDVFDRSGLKYRHIEDGYIYQVAVVDDELQPYKARVPRQTSGHPGFFWSGTEAEFKKAFEKV